MLSNNLSSVFLKDTHHDILTQPFGPATNLHKTLFVACVCSRVALDGGLFFKIMTIPFGNVPTHVHPELRYTSVSTEVYTKTYIVILHCYV